MKEKLKPVLVKKIPAFTVHKKVKKVYSEIYCLDLLRKNKIRPEGNIFNFSRKSDFNNMLKTKRFPGIKLLGKIDYLVNFHNYSVIW